MNIFTFVLALIGSLGTAYSVIMTFYWYRISIDCNIVEYCPSKDALIVYMSFTNHSRLPISITDICVWNDCVLYSCVHTPEIVKTVSRTLNNGQTYQEAIHSASLPINLLLSQGHLVMFTFCFLKETLKSLPSL